MTDVSRLIAKFPADVNQFTQDFVLQHLPDLIHFQELDSITDGYHFDGNTVLHLPHQMASITP